MKILYICSFSCLLLTSTTPTACVGVVTPMAERRLIDGFIPLTNTTRNTTRNILSISNYLSNYPYYSNKNYTIQIKKTKITNIITLNIKHIFVKYNFNNNNNNITIHLLEPTITPTPTTPTPTPTPTPTTPTPPTTSTTPPTTSTTSTTEEVFEFTNEPTVYFNILNNLPYITETPTINKNNVLSNNLHIDKCSSIMCNTNSIIIIIICSSITFCCCMVGLLFYYIKKDKNDKNTIELLEKKDIFFIEENTISTMEKVTWNNP